MLLFKNLNLKVHILFVLTAVTFFIINCSASAHTITSNQNIASPRQQITFTSIFIRNGTGTGYIDYGDGTGEQVSAANFTPNGTQYVVTTTHAYQKPGTYTVRIRSTGITQTGPNPAYMTQQVGSLRINRIQLYFDNNRPDTTIKRNEKSPGLYAKIDYSGSGNFKGYWEIDGVKRAHVFKNLVKGPSVTLKYPSVPPLPTYRFGTHKVRFVVTSPAMNINFPYGIYFVTSDEAPPEPAAIKIVQPSEGATPAYAPVTFKWEAMGESVLYLLNVYSREKEERVFSAYTRQGVYELPPSSLKLYMEPGEEYLWTVVGFNDENEITAESIPVSFVFIQTNN